MSNPTWRDRVCCTVYKEYKTWNKGFQRTVFKNTCFPKLYIHPLALKKFRNVSSISSGFNTQPKKKKEKGFNLHCKQHEKYPYDKVEKLCEVSWVFSNGDKMKTFHFSIRNLGFSPYVVFLCTPETGIWCVFLLNDRNSNLRQTVSWRDLFLILSHWTLPLMIVNNFKNYTIYNLRHSIEIPASGKNLECWSLSAKFL